MHSSCSHHIDQADEVSGYMRGPAADPYPVLRIGDVAIFPPTDPATWLRTLSATCDDLAEQVELTARPGLALAERHIAEAKAAAGIGGRR